MENPVDSSAASHHNRLGLGRKSFPSRDLRQFDEETRRELARSEDPEALAKKYTSVGIQLRYMPRINYIQQMTATVQPLPEQVAAGLHLYVETVGLLDGSLRSEARPLIDHAVERIEAAAPF